MVVFEEGIGGGGGGLIIYLQLDAGGQISNKFEFTENIARRQNRHPQLQLQLQTQDPNHSTLKEQKLTISPTGSYYSPVSFSCGLYARGKRHSRCQCSFWTPFHYHRFFSL